MNTTFNYGLLIQSVLWIACFGVVVHFQIRMLKRRILTFAAFGIFAIGMLAICAAPFVTVFQFGKFPIDLLIEGANSAAAQIAIEISLVLVIAGAIAGFVAMVMPAPAFLDSNHEEGRVDA